MYEQFSFLNVLPSKETHGPRFIFGNCTAFKTDLKIRLPPTGTTISPPISLQGSLLILLPSLQPILSPFLFLTPVSSFSAIPRGNDYLMHENGKELSGAQKINQKNSCMLEFCMRCLEETAVLYTFGKRKGILVRCF